MIDGGEGFLGKAVLKEIKGRGLSKGTVIGYVPPLPNAAGAEELWTVGYEDKSEENLFRAELLDALALAEAATVGYPLSPSSVDRIFGHSGDRALSNDSRAALTRQLIRFARSKTVLAWRHWATVNQFEKAISSTKEAACRAAGPFSVSFTLSISRGEEFAVFSGARQREIRKVMARALGTTPFHVVLETPVLTADGRANFDALVVGLATNENAQAVQFHAFAALAAGIEGSKLGVCTVSSPTVGVDAAYALKENVRTKSLRRVVTLFSVSVLRSGLRNWRRAVWISLWEAERKAERNRIMTIVANKEVELVSEARQKQLRRLVRKVGSSLLRASWKLWQARLQETENDEKISIEKECSGLKETQQKLEEESASANQRAEDLQAGLDSMEIAFDESVDRILELETHQTEVLAVHADARERLEVELANVKAETDSALFAGDKRAENLQAELDSMVIAFDESVERILELETHQTEVSAAHAETLERLKAELTNSKAETDAAILTGDKRAEDLQVGMDSMKIACDESMDRILELENYQTKVSAAHADAREGLEAELANAKTEIDAAILTGDKRAEVLQAGMDSMKIACDESMDRILELENHKLEMSAAHADARERLGAELANTKAETGAAIFAEVKRADYLQASCCQLELEVKPTRERAEQAEMALETSQANLVAMEKEHYEALASSAVEAKAAATALKAQRVEQEEESSREAARALEGVKDELKTTQAVLAESKEREKTTALMLAAARAQTTQMSDSVETLEQHVSEKAQRVAELESEIETAKDVATTAPVVEQKGESTAATAAAAGDDAGGSGGAAKKKNKRKKKNNGKGGGNGGATPSSTDCGNGDPSEATEEQAAGAAAAVEALAKKKGAVEEALLANLKQDMREAQDERDAAQAQVQEANSQAEAAERSMEELQAARAGETESHAVKLKLQSEQAAKAAAAVEALAKKKGAVEEALLAKLRQDMREAQDERDAAQAQVQEANIQAEAAERSMEELQAARAGETESHAVKLKLQSEQAAKAAAAVEALAKKKGAVEEALLAKLRQDMREAQDERDAAQAQVQEANIQAEAAERSMEELQAARAGETESHAVKLKLQSEQAAKAAAAVEALAKKKGAVEEALLAKLRQDMREAQDERDAAQAQVQEANIQAEAAERSMEELQAARAGETESHAIKLKLQSREVARLEALVQSKKEEAAQTLEKELSEEAGKLESTKQRLETELAIKSAQVEELENMLVSEQLRAAQISNEAETKESERSRGVRTIDALQARCVELEAATVSAENAASKFESELETVLVSAALGREKRDHNEALVATAMLRRCAHLSASSLVRRAWGLWRSVDLAAAKAQAAAEAASAIKLSLVGNVARRAIRQMMRASQGKAWRVWVGALRKEQHEQGVEEAVFEARQEAAEQAATDAANRHHLHQGLAQALLLQQHADKLDVISENSRNNEAEDDIEAEDESEAEDEERGGEDEEEEFRTGEDGQLCTYNEFEAKHGPADAPWLWERAGAPSDDSDGNNEDGGYNSASDDRDATENESDDNQYSFGQTEADVKSSTPPNTSSSQKVDFRMLLREKDAELATLRGEASELHAALAAKSSVMAKALAAARTEHVAAQPRTAATVNSAVVPSGANDSNTFASASALAPPPAARAETPPPSASATEFESDAEGDEEVEEAKYSDAMEVLEAVLGEQFEADERVFAFAEGPIGISFHSFDTYFVNHSHDYYQEGEEEGLVDCEEARTRITNAYPPHGAPICVTEVVPGGHADAFGVTLGDLITALNGEKLSEETTNDDFFALLMDTPRPIALTFRRLLNPTTLDELTQQQQRERLAYSAGRDTFNNNVKGDADDSVGENCRVALLERRCVEVEAWAERRVGELEEALAGARAAAAVALAMKQVDESASSSHDETAATGTAAAEADTVDGGSGGGDGGEKAGERQAKVLSRLRFWFGRMARAELSQDLRRWRDAAKEALFEDAIQTERGMRAQLAGRLAETIARRKPERVIGKVLFEQQEFDDTIDFEEAEDRIEDVLDKVRVSAFYMSMHRLKRGFQREVFQRWAVFCDRQAQRLRLEKLEGWALRQVAARFKERTLRGALSLWRQAWRQQQERPLKNDLKLSSKYGSVANRVATLEAGASLSKSGTPTKDAQTGSQTSTSEALLATAMLRRCAHLSSSSLVRRAWGLWRSVDLAAAKAQAAAEAASAIKLSLVGNVARRAIRQMMRASQGKAWRVWVGALRKEQHEQGVEEAVFEARQEAAEQAATDAANRHRLQQGLAQALLLQQHADKLDVISENSGTESEDIETEDESEAADAERGDEDEEEEFRMGDDGQLCTYNEFEAKYGLADAPWLWERAGAPSDDSDGNNEDGGHNSASDGRSEEEVSINSAGRENSTADSFELSNVADAKTPTRSSSNSAVKSLLSSSSKPSSLDLQRALREKDAELATLRGEASELHAALSAKSAAMVQALATARTEHERKEVAWGAAREETFSETMMVTTLPRQRITEETVSRAVSRARAEVTAHLNREHRRTQRRLVKQLAHPHWKHVNFIPLSDPAIPPTSALLMSPDESMKQEEERGLPIACYNGDDVNDKNGNYDDGDNGRVEEEEPGRGSRNEGNYDSLPTSPAPRDSSRYVLPLALTPSSVYSSSALSPSRITLPTPPPSLIASAPLGASKIDSEYTTRQPTPHEEGEQNERRDSVRSSDKISSVRDRIRRLTSRTSVPPVFRRSEEESPKGLSRRNQARLLIDWEAASNTPVDEV